MARPAPNKIELTARAAGEVPQRETPREPVAAPAAAVAVFHDVPWGDRPGRGTPIGEPAFVVVNRAGEALFVERKAGNLTQSGRRLVKDYPARSVFVVDPIHRGRRSGVV